MIKNKKSLTHKWKEFLRLRMLNLIFEQQEEDKLIFQNNLNINNINSNSSELKEAPSKNELKKYLALKNTFLMYDWITGRELKEIEQDYGLLGGAIQKMGEGFSWLADALAALAIGVGWREDRAGDLEKIQQLSARLIAGVEPAGLPLAKLHIPGLSRGYIQRLVQEGYQDEQCLQELSEKQLQPLLPDLLIKKIKEWLNSGSYSKSNKNNINNKIHRNKLNKPNLPSDYKHNKHNKHNQKPEAQSNKNCPPPTKSEIKNEIKAVITINPHRPDQILFLGKEIAVNKIGYQLILFLAQNKGKVISYEQLIDTLWPDDEDATYHRLWYHLGKLRKSMQKIMQEQDKNNHNSGLPDLADLPDNYLKEKLLRVIPGRGLMLAETVSVEIPTVRGNSPETPELPLR